MQDVPWNLDLFSEIERLKKLRRAVVLAHYYQDPDIQDIADQVGDSLALAKAAQQTDAQVLVVCGVYFMAETAKILNPDKVVVLPDVKAGCSLADSCPADAFKAFRSQHADHVVVSYVNTSAAIKALSDWVCTSSNAQAVLNAIPTPCQILFVPDVHLGRYLQRQTGRSMLLWQGSCVVHETFNERYVLKLLEERPGSELIAHPECELSILNHAHFVGSTQALLQYSQKSICQSFVVATEAGLLHSMQKASPDKHFIAAAPQDRKDGVCGCSICPFMRLNTLEKVYLCLRDLEPQICLDEDIRQAALQPIERMLRVG